MTQAAGEVLGAAEMPFQTKPTNHPGSNSGTLDIEVFPTFIRDGLRRTARSSSSEFASVCVPLCHRSRTVSGR